MPQMIGVPKEIFPLERRVATVPEVVEKLIKLGFAVQVETGAGDAANVSDDDYRKAQDRGHRPPSELLHRVAERIRVRAEPTVHWTLIEQLIGHSADAHSTSSP